MMINNAPVDCTVYDYARQRDSDGEIIDVGDYDDMMEHCHLGETVVFRVVYFTAWMPCSWMQ